MVYFSEMIGLYRPIDDAFIELQITQSFVELAQIMRGYELVIGQVYRTSNRFMDVMCYPMTELDYDEYWSAAEESISLYFTDTASMSSSD